MFAIKNFFSSNKNKEARDFLPVLLIIIIISGILLIVASYLAKNTIINF